MEDVVIIDGARTAIGRFGGGFAKTGVETLGAAAIRAAVERAGLEPGQVAQVVLGCAGQFGEDAYVSRPASVGAGLLEATPAYTVNRLCGSGLEALNTAARWLETGDSEIVVAGGAENMSRYPYLLQDARWGKRMGDGRMNDGLLGVLNDPFNRYHMGVTAENLNDQWSLEREELDEHAVASHQKAIAAIDAGRFEDEIVPVEVRQGRKTAVIDTDEHPRRDVTMEGLGALRPAFKDAGDVTAGNASGINDGAAAVVMTTASKAAELGLKPKLRMVGRANSGVDPTIMGTGPIPATERVMERTGLSPADMDVIELNEAFASQALATLRELGVEDDDPRVNPNGGAIALGHPLGAAGASLILTAAQELEETGGKYGLCTMCIGVGQGMATIIERV